jgi:hypothetical protein
MNPHLSQAKEEQIVDAIHEVDMNYLRRLFLDIGPHMRIGRRVL